jgi:hypothetical protein
MLRPRGQLVQSTSVCEDEFLKSGERLHAGSLVEPHSGRGMESDDRSWNLLLSADWLRRTARVRSDYYVFAVPDLDCVLSHR